MDRTAGRAALPTPPDCPRPRCWHGGARRAPGAAPTCAPEPRRPRPRRRLRDELAVSGGYAATYRVDAAQLVLTELEADPSYDGARLGVPPVPRRGVLVYRGLAVPVAFTGRLLIERLTGIRPGPAEGESTGDWIDRTFSLSFAYSWPKAPRSQ